MFNDCDVYLSGDLEVDSIYCSGNILFQDLGDRFEADEYQKKETGLSNLQCWNNSMIAKDLFIEGNIIFNEGIYSEDDIFQKIRVAPVVNTKMMTITCDNFLMNSKITSKDNYIHTTNNDVVVKLRKMKINKLKKND